MGNFRRRNFAPLEPDPPRPKPQCHPSVDQNKSAGLDSAIYVVWTYTCKDADSIDGYMVRVAKNADPSTIIVERWVSEPDTDVIIDGLANGTAYRVAVAARNSGGEGSSGLATITPSAPIIAAPTLTKLTGGDGQAVAEWKWSEPCREGHRYEFMSFEAVNEVGATVTEHVTGGAYPATTGTLPLTNDHDWKVALVSVAVNEQTRKEYPSGLSNTITVHTEKPVAPYKPRLTGAQIAPGNNGQIDVTFAPGIQNVTATRPRRWWRRLRKGDNGPGDITAWQVRLIPQKDPANPITYDVADGNARSYRTDKQSLGTYAVDVRARNSVGWSDWSNTLNVTFTPTDKRPFSSDKPFGTWESATYYYALFDPGNDPKDGWDRSWKCTLTGEGQAISFEVLLVGAGGGGKGQTATFGKGGNGGGGQLVKGSIAAGSCDSFSVFVSIGGSTSVDPKDTNVTANAKVLTAKAGKSASSGTDAAGYDRTFVDEWTDCASAFGWLVPESQYVGGVAQEGKQGFPNGLGWGCAGAGTKTSNPGRGVEGLVVIRWPK